jgi:hypothetical protein
VPWKNAINRVLRQTTGLELRKTAASASASPAAKPKRQRGGVRPGDRLLVAPTFILSTVRSGSTLVRVLIDSHSQLHAPHEMHLRNFHVEITSKYAPRSLEAIGLDQRHVEYLLWDRLLHRELAASGKEILVNKTPSDVFIVDRIQECWPDARFIFLLRHPAAIAASRHATRPQDSAQRNLFKVLEYGNAVEAARASLPGLTVRYEDIASDPVAQTQRICAFLGVEWEPGMVDYGSFDHGRFRPGLGDWNEKIKSGTVQPPAPAPPLQEIDPALRPLCVAWGYLEPDAIAATSESPVAPAPSS